MTNQTSEAKQGGTCRAICWLIAIAAGGYLTFMLISDYGQDRIQSGVIGIVTMLLAGFVLRRIFCRSGRSRVARRVEEAAAQKAAENAPAADPAPTTAKVAEEDAGNSASDCNGEKSIAAESRGKFDAPDAESLDDKLTENVLAAAATIAEKPASDLQSDKPVLPTVPEMPVKSPEPADQAAAPETSETVKPTAPVQVVKVKKKSSKSTSSKYGKSTATSDPAQTSAKTTDSAQSADDAPAPAPTDPVTISPATPEAATTPPAASPPEVTGEKPAAKPSGIKPVAPKGLENPENGKPDDLQKISGIGDVEEKALHDAGIYHYTQFVTMNRRELAWLDENIAATKEVPPSGEWRKQAIALSRKAG